MVSVFWNIISSIELKVRRRFGGTYLPSSCRRIKQLRNHHEASIDAGFLFGLLLDPEDGSEHILPKVD
jgi:hypothetical protein